MNHHQTTVALLTATVLLAISAPCSAAGERPLRAARSANRQFVLKITPGKPAAGKDADGGRRAAETGEAPEAGDAADRDAGADATGGDGTNVSGVGGATGRQDDEGIDADGDGGRGGSTDEVEADGDSADGWSRRPRADNDEPGVETDFDVVLAEAESDGGDRTQGENATGDGDRPADADATGGDDAAGGAKDGRAKKAGGGARATLIAREGGKRWSGRLVNEVAPVQAFVSDDGRHVVTLDEHGLGGARHALVIYGEDGKPRREFKLRELLTRADWREVKPRGKAIEWLRGARSRFIDDDRRFVIRLDHGREIVIDLETAALADESAAEVADGGEGEIPPELAGLMDESQLSAEDQERLNELAAEVFRWVSEVEGLRALLEQTSDPATRLDIQTKIKALDSQRMTAMMQMNNLFLRSGASEATATDGTNSITFKGGVPREVLATLPDLPVAPGATSQTALPDGGVPLLADIPVLGPLFKGVDAANAAGEPPLATGVANQVVEIATPRTDILLGGMRLRMFSDLPPGAGNSPATGVAVPPPDPAKPVNYIDWFKQQADTGDGPSAVPLYQQARAGMVKWEGDPALYDAAMSGDAAALTSPEIQSFLAANQAAMELVAQGNQMPYRGEYTFSDDDDHLTSIMLPTLGDTRQLAKTMVMQGNALAAQGDPTQAARYYLDTMRLGSQASQGNTLIEGLVGTAVQKLSTNALLDTMASGGDAVDYSQIAFRLNAESESLNMRPLDQVFQFERAMMMDTVQRMYSYDEYESAYTVSPNAGLELNMLTAVTGGDKQPMGPLNIAMQLQNQGFEGVTRGTNELYDQITAATQGPYAQTMAQFQSLESQVGSPEFMQANPLAATLMPSISRAAENIASVNSQRVATQLVANIQAYRQANGSLPDSLDVFDGRNFVTDPLTGQRFVYRRTEEGFSLYSAGANGMDDGGVHGANVRENDVVYWPRPARNR